MAHESPVMEAEECERRAIALLGERQWRQSAQAFRQAIELGQNTAGNWGSLAVAMWADGQLDLAEEAYRRSIELDSSSLAMQNNYARLLLERGKTQTALNVLQEVVRRDPSMFTAWVAAGNAFLQGSDRRQAAVAFQRALHVAPADPELRYRVLETLTRECFPEDAEPSVQAFLTANPDSPLAWALVALLRQRQFRLEDSRAALGRSLALRLDPGLAGSLLCLMQYDADAAPDKLLAEHRKWNDQYAAPSHSYALAKPQAHPLKGRLRIGFVSADFGRHPTGYLVLPCLEKLAKDRCSLVFYSDRTVVDEYTARFQSIADDWRMSHDWSHDGLAQQIRNDEIDILFDLMGHNGKRLLTFALKPAPVQITWFGYVGTTGLAAMDYLLADAHHIRPGEERNYSEHILRTPRGYACYQPPPYAPEINPLPALHSGRVTFGSLNNPLKLSASTLDAWAEILRRAPNSQLLLRFGGFEQAELRERIHVEFAQRHVAPDRVLLEGWCPHPELLGTYHRVDLGLDTQPYSGGLTTCEALWMGIPVVTMPGKTFAGRHAVSHLTNAGYPQFIANDWPSYIELAVQWAGRLQELANVRSAMRDQVRHSALCDAETFAQDFLALMLKTHASCQTAVSGPTDCPRR